MGVRPGQNERLQIRRDVQQVGNQRTASGVRDALHSIDPSPKPTIAFDTVHPAPLSHIIYTAIRKDCNS